MNELILTESFSFLPKYAKVNTNLSVVESQINQMNHRKSFLIILDGWGLGQDPSVDALSLANTPNFDGLLEKYTNDTLVTYGEEVGLPEGQMGNSEVGHLNIGAGRIVNQELVRINKACQENTLVDMPEMRKMIDYAKQENKAIHLLGLVSDGGVHAHISHLKSIVSTLDQEGLEKVYIHAFMDGRDTGPKSGLSYLNDLQNHISDKSAKLASLVGRYYAMDRDNRFERIKIAYDLLVHGTGTKSEDAVASLQHSYDNDVTDEFLMPVCMQEKGEDISHIKDGDIVLFYNYRTDRPRQITEVLSQNDMPEYDLKKLDLAFYTMTTYDENFENVHVIFTKDQIPKTIGEIVEDNGLSQLRIAETEKYPHVTFFFSGGREKPFEKENRIMIPSPKVATYDLEPEMGARQIAEAAVKNIKEEKPDFICLNFANTDMVGHTGIMDAAITAAEVVDKALGQVVSAALEEDYEIIVIADHGNSDIMQNPDGTPHTAHTTNMVPLIYLSNNPKGRISQGKLGDIAPTLLHLMGIKSPPEMTGKNLIKA